MSQADPGLATAENRNWLSIYAYSGSDAWRVAPLVSMVNSTNTGQSDNLGRRDSPRNLLKSLAIEYWRSTG